MGPKHADESVVRNLPPPFLSSGIGIWRLEAHEVRTLQGRMDGVSIMSVYQICGGFVLAGILLGAMLWAFQPPKVWHEYNDPYECFGGGRYDAMREGKVCPGWEGK